MENYFDLFQYPVENVLDQLLADRSTGQNIIFATDAYVDLGYGETDKITKDAIQRLFKNNRFQTRVFKSKDSQQERTKKSAEVFTPSWVCNLMLEYLDRDWFGRENVFNKQDGETWEPTSETVSFADLGAERSWESYVKSRRLEISCGEAPFIVSRYDAVNGDIIPIKKRVGILDRKLRVVNENCIIKDEWQKWVETAFQNVYGYEYQGDNLLIARLNLLMTYYEYYKEQWNEEPGQEKLEKIADYIVWNIWQMDGLEDCVPLLKEDIKSPEQGFLFNTEPEKKVPYACLVTQWEPTQDVSMRYKLWKERDDMKFDYVIGNPPYQDNTTGDNKNFTSPIYNIFMDSAFQVSDKVLLIHPARFLFNAGATPKKWNERMLSDEHFKIVLYEQNSDEIFSGTDIRGGSAFLLETKRNILIPLKYLLPTKN